MRREECLGARQAVVEFDLEFHGIGLDVDEPRAVLLARLGAAVEIDDQIGAGVERAELLARHAEGAAVIPKRVVGPAVAEAEPAHHSLDKRGGLLAAVVAGFGDEIARRATVRLDVEDLAPEPLEAERVVDGLPDDAGDGHLAHQAEQHDARAAGDVHADTSSATVGSMRVRTGRFVCMSWSCL